MKRGLRPAELIRRTAQAMTALYSDANPGGLTLPQFSMLHALKTQGPKGCMQLVRITGIDRSTAFSMLERLIDDGLVMPSGYAQRESGQVGKSAVAFKLTKRGLAAVEEAEPAVVLAERKLVNSLPPGVRAAFLESLDVTAFSGPQP